MAEIDDVEEIKLSGPRKPAPDEPQSECPPCKAGAPAWMATFADMATLLMAFFVLILSFAHVNVPKFKNVSGSLRYAFGVQTLIPVIEPPEARNLIATQYMTAEVEPTPMQTIEEQRTDDPQPIDPELRQDVAPADYDTNDAIQILEKALADQIAQGKVSISVVEARITVDILDPGALEIDNSAVNKLAGGQITAEMLEIFTAVWDASEQTSTDIEVISASEPYIQTDNTDSDQQGASQTNSVINNQYEMIRANLSDEIRAGLAIVSRDGDKITIRLAEQGSFASGNAELQPAFLSLLDKVGASLQGSAGQISIEGHTDNVNLVPGGRYRTNWDLSSARAAVVADYLLSGYNLDAGQVSVTGFADTKPIAVNDTAIGRAQNRRIEIIVSGR